MRNKMINHGIAVIGIAILIFLSVASASTPESTPKAIEIVYTEVPYSELGQRVEQVNSLGQGFIVEAYFRSGPGDGTSRSFGLLPDPLDTYKDGWLMNKTTVWISGHSRDYSKSRGGYESYVESHEFEQYNDQTYKRIDKNKLYRIYICTYDVYSQGNGRWEPFIDRIEGLRTLEEVAAIEAQQKAEREAAAEAQRLAREEANRYDPAKFTVVPSDFKPADYTKADLFAAVADSEKMSTTPLFYGGGIAVYASAKFASDVVFVSQNGTDITFRTADNAISKRMKIETRSGLTAGQRVRIYYITYNPYSINDWQVIAIERL